MTDRADVSTLAEDWRSRLVTLHRMIDRLGAPCISVGQGARCLDGSGAECLAGLIDEIDETVLPRRLVVRNARREGLELELRIRRLFHALFVGPETSDPARPRTESLLLNQADAGQLAAFGKVLGAFCDGAPLTLTTLPAASEPALDESGVTAATLRHILQDPAGGDARSIPAGDALRDYLADWAPRCRALVHGAGPDLVEQGEVGLALGLARALEFFGERLDALAGGEPLALCLASGDPALERIAFFAAGATRAALLVAPEVQDALFASWSDWLAGQSGA
ncbi:hypothetical protein [Tropicimonas sp. IMCC6043]|uniref:hypothetical protein n=1 Tax=Tropicimonas sp. IMCC6043 TaxID=2510645 RepID=UPI00101C701B|nr:hypothetical protein [Tropicimonas sp. IMCC6043]RYH10973.1 hypothetical protein EU800_06915 [Tropicimonas sp. IMCC6043]